jgi:hypothetical protein
MYSPHAQKSLLTTTVPHFGHSISFAEGREVAESRMGTLVYRPIGGRFEAV